MAQSAGVSDATITFIVLASRSCWPARALVLALLGLAAC
jgi:hypothetical protein